MNHILINFKEDTRKLQVEINQLEQKIIVKENQQRCDFCKGTEKVELETEIK